MKVRLKVDILKNKGITLADEMTYADLAYLHAKGYNDVPERDIRLPTSL